MRELVLDSETWQLAQEPGLGAFSQRASCRNGSIYWVLTSFWAVSKALRGSTTHFPQQQHSGTFDYHPIYSRGNWGPESFGGLPYVAQLTNGGAGVWTQTAGSGAWFQDSLCLVCTGAIRQHWQRLAFTAFWESGERRLPLCNLKADVKGLAFTRTCRRGTLDLLASSKQMALLLWGNRKLTSESLPKISMEIKENERQRSKRRECWETGRRVPVLKPYGIQYFICKGLASLYSYMTCRTSHGHLVLGSTLPNSDVVMSEWPILNRLNLHQDSLRRRRKNIAKCCLSGKLTFYNVIA